MSRFYSCTSQLNIAYDVFVANCYWLFKSSVLFWQVAAAQHKLVELMLLQNLM